ncbi:hypothetical protein AB0C29_02535 [Actinoplanes sp. NPDC048791]|uniref:tetratricopeptide repeat protein n=1 Tax=Actinoplanes sp. NPDC048791 TaxID=3154623 RepID=UPI00340C4DDC
MRRRSQTIATAAPIASARAVSLVEGAVAAARQAADRGQTSVLSQLSLHLDRHGDFDGALRLAHEAADRGNPIALSRLARQRELNGDPNAAASLYREAVNRANINAMTNSARLCKQAGDTDHAQKIRRFGLTAEPLDRALRMQPWPT